MPRPTRYSPAWWARQSTARLHRRRWRYLQLGARAIPRGNRPLMKQALSLVTLCDRYLYSPPSLAQEPQEDAGQDGSEELHFVWVPGVDVAHEFAEVEG